MRQTFEQAFSELRARISNVKYAGTGIQFDFDGVKHTGALRGRNANLVLASDPEIDAGIATRVLLDQDAVKNV